MGKMLHLFMILCVTTAIYPFGYEISFKCEQFMLYSIIHIVVMCRWMFKLSEWAHFSTYDVGLHSGSTAAHILVC